MPRPHVVPRDKIGRQTEDRQTQRYKAVLGHSKVFHSILCQTQSIVFSFY